MPMIKAKSGRQLKPVEVNPDCRWEQARIRSQGLVKAE
jgi:hypothetical protein